MVLIKGFSCFVNMNRLPLMVAICVTKYICFKITVGYNNEKSRLSNGLTESLNRKVKDLKRLGRGFKNFEHFRNRFLYAERENSDINVFSDKPAIRSTEDDG